MTLLLATYLVTAYCSCPACTGHSHGLTASGHRAGPGTVAADWRVLRPGTRLWVPGYGRGVVRDTGSRIRGRRLDVWFRTHREAVKWGRKKVRIR